MRRILQRASLVAVLAIAVTAFAVAASQARSHPPRTHRGGHAKPAPKRHATRHRKHAPRHHHAKQRAKHHVRHHRGGHARKASRLEIARSRRAVDKDNPNLSHRRSRMTDLLPILRALDGSGNNAAHPTWGHVGTIYPRLGPANYADHASAMQGGPSPRLISNRVFNDEGQNLFSENDVSQWGWVWGQFIDHDIGLRDETPAEAAPMPFDANDPLEAFANDPGEMDFNRTPAAPGTGTGPSNPRQEINTLSSVIDGSQIYGPSATRLAWLTAPNGYDLFLPGDDLPHASDKAGAPPMDLMGPLTGNPQAAVVAGDVRANENVGLTAVQTLFAREHNRIADSLPDTLSPEVRFQIARRVVGAEI